jgi:Serine dehydrogenase proteinase
VLTYVGPMYPPVDDEIKDAVEGIQNRQRGLVVLLETGGGYITVAERIANIFRHHYRRLDFVVPTYAMSAGTVLVMAGDAIHMDYAATLGPIDPQVKKRGEQWVPALGYLEQFNRLIKKSEDGTLTTAELAYLIQNFDPAELYQYEQERELSIALLEEWLVKFKFKNWKKTETSGKKVTHAMRVDRARDIATKLNDTNMWHSHGRGITMEVLRRKLKLLIDDFGENDKLAQPIHDYFRLLQDYQMRRAHYAFVIHTRGRYVGH